MKHAVGRIAVGVSLGWLWLGAGAGQSGGASDRISDPALYLGMCDASAAVAVSSNLFLAADDEGNRLRLFHAEQGGLPLRLYDFSTFLGLTGEHPEADFEGAARLGDRVYWISSHGRNREGKYRQNRHCFFATTIREEAGSVTVTPVGFCYKRLLADLVFEPRLRRFNLGAASARAPKARGGLNIEGMCATAEGHLLIGFRNPIPAGRALLVPLLNPDEVTRGHSARLGDPVLLDLGGLGIRDMAYARGRIYLLAGPYNGDETFRLYTWSGNAEPPRELAVDFRKLRPEALLHYPDRGQFQVLSDDGTRKLGGVRCKDLPDPLRKRFRGAWLPIEADHE